MYESQDDTSTGMSEDGILASVVNWFKVQYPEHARRIYHIKNEGMAKHAGYRAKTSNMGVLKGAPDLVIQLPVGQYSAFTFDAKKDKKYSHEYNQVMVINDLAEHCFAGYFMGVNAGKRAIKDYMENHLQPLHD